MQEENISIELFKETATKIEEEVGKVIVGQKDVIRHVLVAIIAGGHVLLEGVPGLGKTMLVRTLADALQLRFSRIQFTPDLMPADITGTDIMQEDDTGHRDFRFQPGPIFANLVLADEINRATPKTQSALLEAMQEQNVTVSNKTYKLAPPFFVMATQNPIEMEGTYPLPEAQLDRFMFKLNVGFPSAQELGKIMERTTGHVEPKASHVASGDTLLTMRNLARQVPIASHINEYTTKLLLATHPGSETAPPMVRRYVRYGASPRGAQAMILGAKVWALMEGNERYNVATEDIDHMARPSLRHRIILSFEGQAEGIDTDAVIDEIIASLKSKQGT
jgi:MoxR-like ATPase